MPQTTYTAFDTSGKTSLTDMDQVAEQRRREMADQAFRGALLNNQNNMQREGWGRQDALTQQSLSAQERIAAANNANQLAMGGSFQDRSAANRENLMLQMRPAQTMADLETSKWSEGAGVRGAKNQWEQTLLQKRQSLLNGQTGSPNDRVMLALMGIDPSVAENPDDREMKRELNRVLAAKLANGEIDPAQFQAARGGDYSGLPRKEVSSVSPEMQSQALQQDVERFGAKDASTFGFDPGDEDIARILAQRDQVAKAIRMQNPRISPEQATQDANFRIEQGLRPYADRWGTGWVAKLREVMAGVAGGPVREPGGSDFIAEGLGFNDISSLMGKMVR